MDGMGNIHGYSDTPPFSNRQWTGSSGICVLLVLLRVPKGIYIYILYINIFTVYIQWISAKFSYTRIPESFSGLVRLKSLFTGKVDELALESHHFQVPCTQFCSWPHQNCPHKKGAYEGVTSRHCSLNKALFNPCFWWGVVLMGLATRGPWFVGMICAVESRRDENDDTNLWAICLEAKMGCDGWWFNGSWFGGNG